MAVKQVTETMAKAVLAKVEAKYAPYLEDGFGPKLVMDFDWLGDGPSPAIVWEEGPYEWAIEASFDVNTDKVWTEPGTSWYLALYRN